MALQAYAEKNLEKSWLMPSWAQIARDMPGALRRPPNAWKIGQMQLLAVTQEFPQSS